jgi:hypothetical protein
MGNMNKRILLGMTIVGLLVNGCSVMEQAQNNRAMQVEAGMVAEQMGISRQEALRRLQLQDEIGELNARLEQEEGETFAGLWIQHEPVYRVVTAFTRDGEATIQPYIRGKSWAGLVEVRHFQHSLQELLLAQAQIHQAAAGLKIPLNSGVMVMENRVVVDAANPELLLEELEQAGVRLPDAVRVISTYTGSPPTSLRGETGEYERPDGGIVYFPKQAPSQAYLSALMEGVLELDANGCLRVDSGAGFRPVVLWHHDFSLSFSGEAIEIENGAGQIVARTGEPVSMGGGQSGGESFPGLPVKACPGPYWALGEISMLP